jgi:hypothetical protein
MSEKDVHGRAVKVSNFEPLATVGLKPDRDLTILCEEAPQLAI